MATITSELVTEYFSEKNLNTVPFTMFDEFVIPQYLNSVDAKRWLAKIDRISMTPVGSQLYELSWGDYYKFTMNQLIKKHD
jgi:hypothetical protein